MNFLLHRHLAALAIGSPAAGVGAMLPDLWRMADRRVRAAVAPAEETDGPLGDVLAGIEHHLAADARFHRAEAFLVGERATLEALRGLKASRARLFAHVAWELCLDGELVRREGLDAVLGDLRAGFASAGDAAGDAVELHHFARVERTAVDRDAFAARMRRLVFEIERGPWIEGYQRGNGVAVRLSGVRVRLGLAPFDADDAARLADGLDALEPLAKRALDDLLAEPAYFQATSRAANRSARCS